MQPAAKRVGRQVPIHNAAMAESLAKQGLRHKEFHLHALGHAPESQLSLSP